MKRRLAAALLVLAASCARTPAERCHRAPLDPTLTAANIDRRLEAIGKRAVRSNDTTALLEEMGLLHCSLANNLAQSDPSASDMYRTMGTMVLEMAAKADDDQDPFAVIKGWATPD